MVNARYPAITAANCQRAANDSSNDDGDEDVATDDGGACADLAGGDRPVLLLRMRPVGLGVDRVVQEVRPARRQAEAHERDQCPGTPPPAV